MPEDWDGSYKRLFGDFPVSALQVLCDVDAAGTVPTALPTETTMKLRADVVFEVRPAHGEPVLVHIEVQRAPAPDFELRLVKYWLAVTSEHGRPPLQVVVLPRGGPHTGHYTAGGLTLRYKVVDVTTLDRDMLLASDLAPLALGRHPGPDLVDAVVTRIAATTTNLDARATLVDLAMLGADDDVAAMITDSIRRHDMSNVLERTAEGQAILDRGLAQGRTEGRTEGLAQGRTEGRTEGLAQGRTEGRTEGEARGLRVLLAEKFGESPELDALALTLAGQGFAAGLHRIREATTLADIVA